VDDLFHSFGAVLALAGAILLVWALFSDRSRGRRRCPKCWYDLSKTAPESGLRCPECGKTQKHERRLFKTRRRWRWAWPVLVIWLASAYLFVQPKVREDGWASIMPTTVLILAFYMDDPTWAMGELDKRIDFLDPDSLWLWQWRLVAHAGFDAYLTGSNPVARVQGFKNALYAGESLKERSNNISWIAEQAAGGIDDRESDIRMYAIFSLGMTGDYDRAIAQWIEFLDAADLTQARSAAGALSFALRHDDLALDAVIDHLLHKDLRVRFIMAIGLRAYAQKGGTSERAIQALIRAHEFGDMEMNSSYLEALLSFQGCEERSLSILVPMAESPLAFDREVAVRTFSRRTDLPIAQQFVAAALFDRDSKVRQTASFHVHHVMERNELINVGPALAAARLLWIC